MSLGWGLRGYIGGGPLGAMIPGAMVGLALCLLLGRSPGNAAVVAALAAVGMGLGGQMTYGNTIQLAVAEETRAWGLLGLTVKGAVWGLFGGGVVGLALERGRVSWPGLLAMAAGTSLGWWFLNVPRVIYFSIDRQEVWAGLWLGALALLAVERSALAWRFALVAMAGGGVGFGLGGWFQVWGRWNAPHAWVGWWKVMEFFFGFCLGLALGWAAWRWRPVEPEARTVAPEAVAVAFDLKSEVLGRAAILMVLYAEYHGTFRFLYSLLGSGLMAMVGWNARTGFLVGIMMTMAAFVWDLTHHVGFLVLTVVLAHAFRPVYDACGMLLLLTWSANAVATSKALWRGHFAGEHALFLVLGVLVTGMALRVRRSSAPPS